MTVFTRDWDGTYITVPANTEAATLGASRIRETRVDVEERMAVDHSWDGDVDDGEHLKVSFTEPLASDPTNATSKGHLYTKDVSAKAELFWQDEDGNVIQLTSAGIILLDADDIAVNSVDGTKIAIGSDAQGDIMYYDGTDWVILTVGTSGEFLKTLGAAADPVWAVPVAQAAQSAIEAETDEDTYLPPDLVKHNPGVAKAWAVFNGSTINGTADLTGVGASYNLSAIIDNGAGDATITFDVDFSGSAYAIATCIITNTGVAARGPSGLCIKNGTTLAAGSVTLGQYGGSSSSADGARSDHTICTFAAFGDQ